MTRGRGERGGFRATIVGAGAALALLCTGCGSTPEYPVNLSFPSRADRLVFKVPEKPPERELAPGELEEAIAQLDSLGGKTADPAAVPNDVRLALNRFLKDTFGTPAAPKVAGGDASAAAERLGLNEGELAKAAPLYRRHCQQCHNLSGDGRGPAGRVTPFPRDLRMGEFKFTSTGTRKPRRGDLLRTLVEGLKGTAMPAFGTLPEGDRDLLTRYATYISIRGEVEFKVLAAVLSDKPPPDVPAFAAEQLKAVLAEWEGAEAAPRPIGISPMPDDGDPVTSPAHAAAVRRGYQLFIAKTDTRPTEKAGTKADNSCISCHGDFGRKPVLRYDAWGLVAKPADLTATSLKGSTRPEDVFARVRGGIPAVGMPAHPDLSDRQVWDLVRFVRSAPYMRELPEDVRAALYPNP